MTNQIKITDFSQHLFWDVDKESFDLDKYKVQMIAKALEYGNWKDWDLLKNTMG